MSSPTKAKKAPAKEKDASEIAGLTQNEIKYLLLANLCMPDSGKIDWELLATFTGTKAKTARGAHLKARRKLEGAYHEALEAYQDKNEASDSNAEAKVPEKK